MNLAASAREESRAHTAAAMDEIMDVNREAVLGAFREYGVKRMIHGHTHRPCIHQLTLDGEQAQRIVLGDWYTHGSVLRMLPAFNVSQQELDQGFDILAACLRRAVEGGGAVS